MTRPRKGRPEAAASIWGWERTSPGEDLAAEAGRALRRASVKVVVAFAVAALFYFFWSRTLALVVAGAASLLLLAAISSPRGLYAAMERLIGFTGQVVGKAAAWVLMILAFYLLFVPFGAFFRRGRKDRLRRYFDADVPTYWSREGEAVTSSRSRLY